MLSTEQSILLIDSFAVAFSFSLCAMFCFKYFWLRKNQQRKDRKAVDEFRESFSKLTPEQRSQLASTLHEALLTKPTKRSLEMAEIIAEYVMADRLTTS